MVSAGAITSVVGPYLYNDSNPGDTFWRNAVSRINAGETRADDVRRCLGRPSSISRAESGGTWGYGMSKTGFLGLGASSKTVVITFNDGIVSRVKKLTCYTHFPLADEREGLATPNGRAQSKLENWKERPTSA